MRNVLLGATILAFSVRPATAQSRQELEDAAKPLIAVLDVKFGGGLPDYGAGIIVGVASDRLYIVTANHVVRHVVQKGSANVDAEADAIDVGFSWLPGETRKGHLLATFDDQLDVAVVAVEGARILQVPALPFERFGMASSLTKGDIVHPMGYPDRQARVTRVQPAEIASIDDRVRFESSFDIVPGYSGGALFTSAFRIVGLLVESDTRRGGGLAVPIERVNDKLKAWNYPVAWKVTPSPASTDRSARGDAASPRTSLVGPWQGSPFCPLIFSTDDGKRIEGNCDNEGFLHKFVGDYFSPTKVRLRITRIDRKTGCSTTVSGELEVIDHNTIRVRQDGWNGCGVRTEPAATQLIR
jgi:trypsin-like peptidase